MIQEFIPTRGNPEPDPPDRSPGLFAVIVVLLLTVCLASIGYMIAKHSGLSVTLR